MTTATDESERKMFSSVHGISDARRLARVGRIRLGVKSKTKGGKEYPTETDYFVFDVPAADASAAEREIHERVIEAYGPKPKALEVLLPDESREVFFPQAYKAYGAAGLKCVGDGQTANRLGADGTFHPVEGGCPCPANCKFAMSLGRDNKPGCKFNASLFVILPSITLAGCFQVVTGSVNAAIYLNSTVDKIRAMFGRLTGLAYVDPETGLSRAMLQIVRRPTRVQYEGKSRTHYLVFLEPRITIDEYLRLRSGSFGPGASAGANNRIEAGPEKVVTIEPVAPAKKARTANQAPPKKEAASTEAQVPAEKQNPFRKPVTPDDDINAAFDKLDLGPKARAELLKKDHSVLRRTLIKRGVLADPAEAEEVPA